MNRTAGWLAPALVCALAAFCVTGCNTVKGAGQDIQKGGQAVENAAVDVQQDMRSEKTHAISAKATRGGTISPSGAPRYPTGSHPSFTITASPGYHIVNVVVDGKSVGAVNTYTFNSITARHSISAEFAADQRQR